MPNYQEIINSSGFPLQMRLEQLINDTKQDHGWSVLVSEHRWEDLSSKDEGFIDLILRHKSLGYHLVIECKRFIGSWFFLVPNLDPQKKDRLKVLSSANLTGSLLWEDVPLNPTSFETKYCIMESQEKRDKRTLEKMAGDLLLSMEQVANDEWELIKSMSYRNQQDIRSIPTITYIPILITSASLFTYKFDPSQIDLDKGELNFLEDNLSPCKFIRFRKNLATKMAYNDTRVDTLFDLNRESDRSVIVINSEFILDFLQMLSQCN